MRGTILHVLGCLLLFATAGGGQELPRGVIVDDVKCAADPSQSYALYVPSTYSPDKRWSLLLGFHPAGRGRAIVETYQAAAERYGYIVAASNNSRNGPWSLSAAAVKAMGADIDARFSIDPQRLYLTGHSGGARVATTVALANKSIAGVIASSAGYPDTQPRSKVTFALFGTAGTDDFNYIEMRMLDRKLTTPHRLAIFPGGHTLPPGDVALEAIEWMELQAMKAGRRTHDDALVAQLYEKRMQKIASAMDLAGVVLLEDVVADFKGLRDVAADEARARELASRPQIKTARAEQKASDDEEARLISDLGALEACLPDEARRPQCVRTLRDLLSKLSRAAQAAEESLERSRARRVLRALTSGSSARTQDREYLALLEQYGIRSR
jgi:hypothetical protein